VGYVKHVRRALVALSATVVVLVAPGVASAQQLTPGGSGLPEASSPDLIDRAQEAGRIDNETANLYRVYVLKGDPRLPGAYESNTPFDGTLELRQARRELRLMEPGTERRRVAAALSLPARVPPDPNPTFCDALSATPLLDSSETDHFYIQYNEAALEPSLTIEDYEESLETSWTTEVGAFGWAAPPVTALAQTDIGGKYHVRIDALAPVLYGFVSSQGTYAGPVGDNPDTTWDDQDADASCMGLNQDYSAFPGTPRRALDATTAHEFNHSLQFGYGALNGENVPDDNFIEGGATWMEDEVQDDSDDNYNYLYPQFDDSMGEHDEGDIYAYWLTWRGITERFTANAPGGSEEVMQEFWEIISRNEAEMLDALQTALAAKGRTLPGTYHDYAVAAKFMRPCGIGGVRPYCFEEASGYTTATGGPPGSQGSATTTTPYDGTIEDNYTINWVDLPSGGAYNVTVRNNGGGGQLRATIACSTASGVALAPAPAVVGSGQETTIPGFNPALCGGPPVAVITNQAQTAGNPPSSADRAYRVSLATAPASTSPSVPPPVSEEAPDNSPYVAPAGGGNTTGGGGNTSGGGSTTTVTDTLRPALNRITLSSRRFRATRSGRAITASRRGMRVRYSLNKAATVTVRYERTTTGRRVGGRCRTATRANSRRSKCVRWVLVRGTARHSGKAGANAFRLTGRMNGRAVRPGVYRLRLSARDGAGNASATRRSAAFRISRR